MTDQVFEIPTNFPNDDLVVSAFDCSQPGPARNLDLMKFISAEDMGTWEFAAYQAYGDERCVQENIDFLGDLFGKEFEAVWNQRRNVLLARDYLERAKKDLVDANERIRIYEQMIANPSIKFGDFG